MTDAEARLIDQEQDGSGFEPPGAQRGEHRRWGQGHGLAIAVVRGTYLSGRGIGCRAEVLIDTTAPVVPGQLAASRGPLGVAVGVARYTDQGALVLFADTRGPKAGTILCCCADAVPLGRVVGTRQGFVPA